MRTRSVRRLLAATSITLVATATLTAPTASAGEWRVTAVDDRPGYDWLGDVVALGPSNAWAFGTTLTDTAAVPTAKHWNGQSWSDSALPADLERGIGLAAASGSRNVWAFGGSQDDGSDVYALRWNGYRWTVAHRWQDAGQFLTDAEVVNPWNVWVFGYSRVGAGIGTWHFDGRTWSEVETPPLGRASAVAGDDIWAVGAGDGFTGDNLLARWDGQAWTEVTVPGLDPTENHQVYFSDVYAKSARDVWVVGNEYTFDDETSAETPLALHYDGTAWNRLTPPDGATSLTKVEPDGRGGVWVVAHGEAGQQLLSYDGASWTTASMPRPDDHGATVHAVTAVPRSHSTWAVGETYPPDRSDSSGTIWRR